MSDAIWSGQGSELAQIEFRSVVTEVRDQASGPQSEIEDAAEAWLTGQSAAVERLRSRATQLGSEGAAVGLIYGETGTGKLRVAQWIHRCSARAARPLLILDALDPAVDAAIDRVLEAMSMGGASVPGTIVLQHAERVEETTLIRLLDVLGKQGVELVTAVCLVAKHGPDRLRGRSAALDTLLARATRATILVPSLRQRSGDIAALTRAFAFEFSRRYDRQVRGVSPRALSKLEGHEFSGNVRELRAMVEQAVLRSSGDWVTAESFHGINGAPPLRARESTELVIRMPGSSLREIEIEALRMALSLSSGRIVRASELLGITRHALRRKLEKFGLNDLRAQPPSRPQL